MFYDSSSRGLPWVKWEFRDSLNDLRNRRGWFTNWEGEWEGDYEENTDDDNASILTKDCQEFKDIWAELDTNASNSISIDEVEAYFATDPGYQSGCCGWQYSEMTWSLFRHYDSSNSDIPWNNWETLSAINDMR